ncbi:MAG: argininosuccinate lyase [Pseudomonadota bacterium]
MSRLWDKGVGLDDRVLRYTAGEDHQLDERLVAYDVRASSAHAAMLHNQGLISETDCNAIVEGLSRLGAEHADGQWHISLQEEDVHTALESRLTDRIGEAGRRLHLGRSRNDQVLAALRLYLRDATQMLSEQTAGVIRALFELAGREAETPLPGYTHMQQAMPSSVALWAGGFASCLQDDIDGLSGALRRINTSPLGSAAGYGTPAVPIDRAHTATQLEFAGVQEPVTAVQLSRGKAESQLCFEINMVLGDCARMAADLLLFYTQEFAYVALPTSLTTGSSIMPQKRNPDVLELVRAAPATAQACMDECLMLTQKLTSGYHRDLQRLKAPLFRAIDLADDTLAIMQPMLDGVQFRRENIRLDAGLYAAEQANRLVVEQGMTFRDAYRQVGKQFADGDT